MSELLPQEYLDERCDAPWETDDQSPIRVALAMEWAEPLLVAVQVAMDLGADDETDEQFNELTTNLYDGLRDRLTRQDLLYVALMFLNHKTAPVVDNIKLRQAADLAQLDTVFGRRRLTEPSS